MLVYIVVLAFLASPGVLAALLSKKVRISKTFGSSYTQVLVSSIVVGVLYTLLKAKGMVREGFQFRKGSSDPFSKEFTETTCSGPENTKCKLKPIPTAALAGSFRYGECVRSSDKTLICSDSLDEYNATNWTNGKLVKEEDQPGYAEKKKAAEELAKKIQEENAAAAAKREKIEAQQAIAAEQATKVLLADKDVQAFIRANYKNKKTGKPNTFSFVKSVAGARNSSQPSLINKKVLDAFVKAPAITESGYTAYIKTLP